MTWTTTDLLPDYEAAAGAFLRGDVVRHTVLLTVVEGLRRDADRFGDDPPRFGWWTAPDGTVRGAYLCTPPFPPLLSTMPETAAAELARVHAGEELSTPGVNGPVQAARAFAAEWTRLTGIAPAGDGLRSRLYRLDGLVPPERPAPGAARFVHEGDRALLKAWLPAFVAETGTILGNPDRLIDRMTADGLAVLWEDDGRPVSLAARYPQVDGMARIGPVYTPPESRGRGYAAQATASASRAALDAGVKELLLFTDLANPTSNALYQRLGYRPLEDMLNVSL
ncbi:GNAT family N-acetyltransferase [Streptomyces smaragdinus]|nr:GNAT family N-acetyltransferase [Streptomyces smaragdinus]